MGPVIIEQLDLIEQLINQVSMCLPPIHLESLRDKRDHSPLPPNLPQPAPALPDPAAGSQRLGLTNKPLIQYK